MPGQPVTEATPLSPLLRCIGVGGDPDSYALIADKLAARNCRTVADLAEWSFVELKGLLLTLSLPKNFRAYMSAIATTAKLDFTDGGTAERSFVHGANWNLGCTKKVASDGFNPSTFTPDRRCYEHLPQKGSAKYIDTADLNLYVDCLWLEMQVHPEPSIGEYLGTGMKRRLKKIHNQHFPPPKPFNVGSVNEKPRDIGQIIALRFQNARNFRAGQATYKRMVIDEAFKCHFSSKVVESIVFVPALNDIDGLLHNKRNAFLRTMVELYQGAGEEVRVMPCAAGTHV